MHTVRVSIDIAAPPERCFDLARDVVSHLKSAADTGERVVAGRPNGLLELGDAITFEARHFGVRQRLSAIVTSFDRPKFFQDRMTKGAFRFLEHNHHFKRLPDGGTRMIDKLRFQVPLGLVGWPVGQWIVGPHLRRFLVRRGQWLKAAAESSQSER